MKNILEKTVLVIIFGIVVFFTVTQFYGFSQSKAIENKIIKNEKLDKPVKLVHNNIGLDLDGYLLKRKEGDILYFSKGSIKIKKSITSLKKKYNTFDFGSFFKKYEKYTFDYENDQITFISLNKNDIITFNNIDNYDILKNKDISNLIFSNNIKIKLLKSFNLINKKEYKGIIMNMNFSKNKKYIIVRGKGYKFNNRFVLIKVDILKKTSINKLSIKNFVDKYKLVGIEEQKTNKNLLKANLSNNNVTIRRIFSKYNQYYEPTDNFYKNKSKIDKVFNDKRDRIETQYSLFLK